MSKYSPNLNGIYWATNGTLFYIVLFDSGKSKECIKMKKDGQESESFHITSSFMGHQDYIYTPATLEQKHWLHKCIEAKKALSKKECNYKPPTIEYQIY